MTNPQVSNKLLLKLATYLDSPIREDALANSVFNRSHFGTDISLPRIMHQAATNRLIQDQVSIPKGYITIADVTKAAINAGLSGAGAFALGTMLGLPDRRAITAVGAGLGGAGTLLNTLGYLR